MLGNNESKLQQRIEGRRRELIAKLTEITADTRQDAAVARDKIKARLSELDHLIKQGIVDGWSNVNEIVKSKLESWLKN